jgi:hypothetical protein
MYASVPPIIGSFRRIGARVAVLLLAVAPGCAEESLAPPGPGLEINVAPLTLPGVADVCYELEVLNESGATVWTKSPICADQYGDGSSAITFVGACDADDDGDGDTLAESVVILRILGLYSGNGPHTAGDPNLITEYRNPCAPPYSADGCQQTVVCSENADTRVTFDLTIMREANQGFFDIGVNFSDIFCSAKVDCVKSNDASQAIELVFDPVTGERVPTVVLAFACTDGDAPTTTAQTTHLYADDLVIDCGATSYAVSPSAGPGNLYPGGVGAPDPLVQAMVFEGVEVITNQGVDADKRYWNVALGLDSTFFAPDSDTPPTCFLKTRLAASSGPLTNATTPSQTYPFVNVNVQLNDGLTRKCTTHPLDGSGANGGVSTAYTPVLPDGTGYAVETFCNEGLPSGAGGSDINTAPTAACGTTNGCSPNPCGENAICSNVAGGFSCACAEGYEGNPITGCTCAVTNTTCGSCLNEIIDFEDLSEGTPVNTQYQGQGVVFSIVGTDSILPFAVVEGGDSPAAFQGTGTNINDNPMPSGSVGITRGGETNDIQMAFADPVEDLRLYVTDIDASDSVKVYVYLAGSQIGTITKSAGETNTGNGIATEFSFPGLTIDRAVIERRRNSASSTAGYAVDYISYKRCTSQFSSPPSEAYVLMQESAPGASDFETHILGTVRPFNATASASALYSYGTPAGSSFNGMLAGLTAERSHLFLSKTANGISLFVVHDKPANFNGGTAKTTYTWSGNTGTASVTVQDDPSPIEEGPGAVVSGNSVTAAHTWSNCCTDGYVISGLDGPITLTGGFSAASGPAFSGLDSWYFYSGDGGQYPLVLQAGRRIRIAKIGL